MSTCPELKDPSSKYGVSDLILVSFAFIYFLSQKLLYFFHKCIPQAKPKIKTKKDRNRQNS